MKTRHEYRGYVFVIEYYPRAPAFGVAFPDIPEIITSGDSLAEAFENACEALDLHLEGLQKLGLSLPQPRLHLVIEPIAVP